MDDSRRAVKLPAESWRALYTILLREAMRLERAGEMQDVAQIMDLLAPAVEPATESEVLIGLRKATRQQLGLPALGDTG